MDAVHAPGDRDPNNILIVVPTWVGDFVMATPALRSIRDRFPAAHISFLIEPNLLQLAQGGDWMNECIAWPDRAHRGPISRAFRTLLKTLRDRRFEWAVVLPNSFRAAFTAWLAGAQRRIGYNRDGRGFLLTDRLPVRNRRRGRSSEDVPPRLPVRPQRFTPLPLVDYYADLAEAIGCRRPGDRLELFTECRWDQSVAARLRAAGWTRHQPVVVLSPGARYGLAKCWPPVRFAATGDRLVAQQGAMVIVTCGPGEEPIARSIGAAMRERVVVFDKPRLNLGELKSLIRRANLLICNDAGPRHLAKAFGVPVVTVFGPTHPVWTATSHPHERTVRIDVDCGPCQQRVCPLGHLECIEGVTVDMVHEAATDLMRSREENPVGGDL